LDTIGRTYTIYPFTEEQLQKATALYAKLETSPKKGQDQVLVRTGDLKSLKAAYPNYFLDVREFIDKLSVLIEEAKE